MADKKAALTSAAKKVLTSMANREIGSLELVLDGKELKVNEMEEFGLRFIPNRDERTGVITGIVGGVTCEAKFVFPMTENSVLRDIANQMPAETDMDKLSAHEGILRGLGPAGEVLLTAQLNGLMLLKYTQRKEHGSPPVEAATFSIQNITFANG
jgi:hypothetical protein